MAATSALPFLCFTDGPAPLGTQWQVRPFTPLLPADNTRSQRVVKLLPQRYLPDFDQSLYIDNSVTLLVPPEQIFAAADLATGIALPWHSFRATLRDEFFTVLEHGLDDPARVLEQLDHYQTQVPQCLDARPYWAGLMLRDHRHPAIAAAMEIWLAHILRYSRRDQLSSNAAFHLANLRPTPLNIDNHKSAYHSWPHIESRQAQRRLWPNPAPAAALELARLRHEHHVLLSSTSWRMTAPLRAVVRVARAKVSKRFFY